MHSVSSESYFLEEVDSHIQANLGDSVVQEALKNGVDLREYSTQVEDQLKAEENLSIQDYIQQSQNIASLHNQIVSCDEILERCQNMLLSFQTDLGSISSEIMALQQQSVQMNLKLQNRQAVRGELSQFVGDMVIPEQMITVILDSPVTDQLFLDQLVALEQKITFLKEQSFRGESNHGKINTMLKFSFYFKFLMANDREIAAEVRDDYCDTMSKVLFSYFKSYSGRLAKLQFDEIATREDLVGAIVETSQRGVAGFFGKTTMKAKASVFSIGERGQVIDEALEAPIIVPHHVQQKAESKFSYEVLFRSEQFCFLENACREYVFITQFFMVEGNELNDLFHLILGKTESLLKKAVDLSVQESYDAISLFLCLHLLFAFRKHCQMRKIATLDKYWDNLQSTLWHRFRHVMQLNIQSIRDCDPLKLKTVDQRPHLICRRYAELSAGFMSIQESDPNENISRLLSDLQQEVEYFILKMTSVFDGRKNQLLFLINNYDMILSVLAERVRNDCQESDSFKDLLATRTSEFVELILESNFGELLRFIKRVEPVIQQDDDDDDAIVTREGAKVASILKDFNVRWKKALDGINSEILGSFPNFKNGTSILQQTLTQFVQYYHRFYKIMSHPQFSSHPERSQLINVHQLMVEVKKFKSNF
ncbi:hypothetical protein TCAL_08474 [Tigriopus californicus]|uniref:Vacuolar protein sorting-associated protein 52 homolog n=1 Tax=Tigriopus californicus TaxID=6832 RepID=A0A553N987_TIGCA|nr:hypothetical protein TCAL_08474 [Tigriopus californicus]